MYLEKDTENETSFYNDTGMKNSSEYFLGSSEVITGGVL